MGIDAKELGMLGFFTSSGAVPTCEVLGTMGFFMGVGAGAPPGTGGISHTNKYLPVVPKRQGRK